MLRFCLAGELSLRSGDYGLKVLVFAVLYCRCVSSGVYSLLVCVCKTRSLFFARVEAVVILYFFKGCI